MTDIVLIGSGNVACNLFRAIGDLPQHRIVQVAGRSTSSLAEFVTETDTTDNLRELKKADIYLLAIADDAITEVAAEIAGQDGLVAHTSGSISIEALKPCPRRAVCYPLQTFSKERNIDFGAVPIFIEAGDKADIQLVRELAEALSTRVIELDSPARKQLHLAAVFTNNFTNHLLYQATDLCKGASVTADVLLPLLRETVDKAAALGAFEAQTGPARRGDTAVMEAQLEALQSEAMKNIYKAMSASIQSTYGKQL